MGATGLESHMQKNEGEACDGGYALISLHVAKDGRKWWRTCSQIEGKWKKNALPKGLQVVVVGRRRGRETEELAMGEGNRLVNREVREKGE